MEEALLAMACAISLLWWIPQFTSTLRSTDLTGVSASTWVLAAANFFAWVCWASVGGFWAVAGIEAVQCAGAVMIVTKLKVRRNMVALVAVGLALTACAWLLPPAAGLVAVISAVAVRVPQLLRVRSNTAGVSRLSWAMSVVGNGLWCLWAVLASAPVMIAGAGAAAVMSTAVVVAQRPQE